MKAYKGFNKDMTCRDFQYEEGKTYETDEVKMCESGFHACEDPLDCFRYYDPAESVYHEVEIEDNGERQSNDTKVVGKKITIGAELSLKDLIKAKFEYNSKKCTSKENGGDQSAVQGSDRSAVRGGNLSAVQGGDRSAVQGGDWSAVRGGDQSAVQGSDRSAVRGGNLSAVQGGDQSAVQGGNLSAVQGGYRSAVRGGYLSAVRGGDQSAVQGGNLSVLLAGVGSKFRGGMRSVFAYPVYEGSEIVKMAVAVVDGEKIKPNTWYTVKNGEWVEAE